MTNIFSDLRRVVLTALGDMVTRGELPPRLDFDRLTVEPPRDPAHGDLATNAAMVLARVLKENPMALAERIAAALAGRELTTGDYRGSGFSIAAAQPGFLNIKLAPEVWYAQLRAILRTGTAFGDSRVGDGGRVNVEFVSTNPTGPMHVAHGRGAVVGDALASLLAKAGFRVQREYYINDSGAQVDNLARSTHLRYREALGEAVGPIPEGFYPGDYLVETGCALAERDGQKWLGRPEAEWLQPIREFAVEQMMALIRADLTALNVRHDLFVSERELVEKGAVDECLAELEQRGLIYTGMLEPPKGKPPPDDWEPRPLTLFRATRFGDDIDRPIKKSDGTWTYLAADIAYHRDKFRRGFTNLIDVWGADHGGYVKRLQAAVRAVTDGAANLDVKLCQLVHLFDKGVLVRMSKRAGTFVTLREVVDEVGKDVFRFIMLTRRNDQTLEFDFAKVTEQSKDNPVFYVQYAHARAASVMRHAAEEFPELDLSDTALARAPLERLCDSAELMLIRQLAGWPRLVEGAAEAHEPHRIAFFLQDVAAQFHMLWNKGKDEATLRFIVAGDPALTRARLALVRGVAAVIASGLAVIGVEPVQEM
ncbi:MAG TPA: arginine--tRNA ligase [Stellaceae bacterium]|nr:arginine--tRNA ligase [Stellaceae bacterium]HMD65891.1 arginine--tRNA ligase [Stellaceae bacterium]